MLFKKVIHIVEDLKIGGLEKVISSIVLNLNKNKFTFEVWCLARGGEIANELIQKNVKVKIFAMSSYHNPLNIIKIANHLKKSKVDILHTHGYFASTFGRFAAILAKTPVIITHIHTTYYGFKKRNILIEKFLSYFTDKIVCVSESTRKFVEKIERIENNKICVIYNGSATNNGCSEKTLISRSKLAISGNDFVIITVASLVANKGHKNLLDAITILSKKQKNLCLLVVGEGPLKNELKAYSNNLQISPRVIFTGLRKDVFSLLKLSDLFVLSSTEREGLGVALIEAMSQGLALIGTKIGGIPEVIENNVNGLLVAPENPCELADAILRMMTDKSKREKMAQEGKKIFKKKFSIQIMIEKIELLYDECVK